LLPDADYESYVIESGSPAVNSTIGELDIQSRTGAHVVAVRRGNRTVHAMDPDFVFEKKDIILLIGDKSSLKNAYNLFLKNR
jgi:K+/H+ antiporter YhaU regulatory subunit KhtT